MKWISGNAHVCPKCGEMFQIFSCSECESDITEKATVCPSCGKNTFSIYGLIVLIGYYQSHFLLLYPHLF